MDRVRYHRKAPEPAPKPVWRRYPYAFAAGGAAVVLLFGLIVYKLNRPAVVTTDPVGKLRLEKLFSMYRLHVTEKGKAPANEQALKDFINSLSAEEKTQHALGDDIDSLFVSARDGQPFAIRYGVRPNPGGGSEAIMWEQSGESGKRYVALTMGYVDEYGEEDFKDLKKK